MCSFRVKFVAQKACIEKVRVRLEMTAASEAALESIAALQKRIKALEYDNINIAAEYESLSKQLHVQNLNYSTRKSGLSDADSQARAMLATANESLKQIQGIRDENARLKRELGASEQLLQRQKEKNALLRQELRDATSVHAEIQASIKDHDALIAEMCRCPAPVSVLPNDEALLLVSRPIPEGLLTDRQAQLHEKMRQLPKSFPSQNIATKRDILRTLTETKEIVTDLVTRIRFLEKKRCKSTRPSLPNSDVHKLASQQIILSDDMKQFKFA